MRLGLAIAGLVWVLGTGCAATVSQTEHREALTQAQARYEGWLAAHRREVERAQIATARCLADAEARTEIERTRVLRLERSLTTRASQGRRRGGGRKQAGPASRLVDFAGRMPASAGIQRSGERVTLVLPAAGLFTPGSVVLHAEGRAVLNDLMPALEGSSAFVTVAAHVDRLFDAQVAWKLSADRARAVVAELQTLGLDPTRLALRAHAGYAPGTGGLTERIELVFEAVE